MSEKNRTSRPINVRNAVALTLALGSLHGVSEANASQAGGAVYQSPAPAMSQQPARQPGKNSACPKAEKISRNTMTVSCRKFLMRTLRDSVYDDTSDTLAVATYQKLAKLGGVDGVLGPVTAKNILNGNALSIASPDPHPSNTELYVKKSDQVAYVYEHATLQSVVSVSTGFEKPFSETGKNGEAISGVAHTPTGTWKINERVMGADYMSPLGAMPYARFYNEGYAIHAGNVDVDGRDSHGCVRFSLPVMRDIIAPNFGTGDTVTIVE